MTAKTERGQTVLFCAGGHGHSDIVRLLLTGDGVPSTRLNDDVKDLREWLADYPDDQRFSKVTRLLDELKVNI